jgi:undecaprenyl-diphosphatase
LWPGTSRSLVTILGGLAVGLSLPAAVEFSFLLGLLTLSAATGYKTLKAGSAILNAYGGINVAIGFVVATISAFVAVKWMIGYLNRHGLALFGYYRIALACVVGGLLLAGVLS